MRWIIKLQIISKRSLGMTQMPMRYNLLELPAIKPVVLSFFLFLFLFLFFIMFVLFRHLLA